MVIVFFLVAMGASTIGAISGIGGGVIIKPVMDSLNVFPTATVNFLSGCTVLAMAISSYIRGLRSKTKIDYKITIFLAVGASVGGIVGKQLFSMISGESAGLIQASLLLAVNFGVLLYFIFKSKITTKNVCNPLACAVIGLTLGTVSSFLGIGGGPINIAVLYYFFSMNAKESATNSLFIILFSQITSLTSTVITGIPVFDPLVLGLMCVGGVSGAICGGFVSKKMKGNTAEKFFMVVLIFLIAINLYNIVRFVV